MVAEGAPASTVDGALDPASVEAAACWRLNALMDAAVDGIMAMCWVPGENEFFFLATTPIYCVHDQECDGDMSWGHAVSILQGLGIIVNMTHRPRRCKHCSGVSPASVTMHART